MTTIKLTPTQNAESHAICSSKLWGNPLMPDSFEYPCFKDSEGEEGQYDFICQINCADLGENEFLPSKGILYFFAKIGAFLGNFWEEELEQGYWAKEDLKVIYTPRTDFESFVELALSDEDGYEVSFPEQALSVEVAKQNDIASAVDQEKYIVLLCIESQKITAQSELLFPNGSRLYFLIPKQDLLSERKTFKNAIGYLG